MTEPPLRGVQTVEICAVSKLGINKANNQDWRLTVPPPPLHFITKSTPFGDGPAVATSAAGKQRAVTGKGFQTILQLKNWPTGGAALAARQHGVGVLKGEHCDSPFPKLMQICSQRC